MTRQLADWLPAFLDFTKGTESPRLMHFWSGVSAIAGALRRKVWIDMEWFQWTPSFYIIFVADPGVVTKTTTMDMGMNLLKEVPGIKFGPDSVTWQALAGKFVEAEEMFEFEGGYYPMSPLTLASGELGDLVNPQDRAMINFYISMWDGRKNYDKATKMSGNDNINRPWINLIGCTTPHWIADNMPKAVVGGGFTSRCIFVFAEEKETLVTFPDEHVRPDHAERRAALINDLEHMAVNLVGPYTIPEDARAWQRAWYEKLWRDRSDLFDKEAFKGYRARKQTHLNKLAMVLAASRSDERVVTLEDMLIADKMLVESEKHLEKVFSRIGRSETSLESERLLRFVKAYGKLPYAKVMKHFLDSFPDHKDFEGVLTGLLRSNQVKLVFEGMPRMENGKMVQDSFLVYCGE